MRRGGEEGRKEKREATVGRAEWRLEATSISCPGGHPGGGDMLRVSCKAQEQMAMTVTGIDTPDSHCVDVS